MAMNYLMVGLGGILGACARYLATIVIRYEQFPYHTLFVNVLGCLMIGLISEMFVFKWHLPNEFKLFLVTGFLGAFTTFSTFALDTGTMVERGEYLKSFVYVAVSVIAGLAAYFAAIVFIRHLYGPRL